MIRSEKIEQVCASMFAVQRDAGQPKKDSKANAGKFSYDYLSLPGLIEHLAPHLLKWSLYVTQEVRGAPGKAEVYTTVWHSGSQQWIEFGPALVPARSEDPQDHGSAITYCRRYALAAVFNIAAEEDDDASGRGVAKPSQGTATPPPSKSAGEKTSPPVGSTPVDVATSPDGYGEGSNGEVATPEQWARLTAVTNGNEGKMRNRINKAGAHLTPENPPNYTTETMRYATPDEVALAITGAP